MRVGNIKGLTRRRVTILIVSVPVLILAAVLGAICATSDILYDMRDCWQR